MQFKINFIFQHSSASLVALMDVFARTHQFAQAGDDNTDTGFYFHLCHGCYPPMFCEACSVMTKLTLATSGGVTTRQIREYILNL